MTRRINAAGLALVKQWEGCELKAYRDIVGVWTIGYGSTGAHVKPGMVITEAQAEKLLKDDLDRFERAVDAYVQVPLNDNQFATLVSFAFNLGQHALKSSTLLKKLNAGNYPAVPSELMKWVHAGGKRIQGLVNRRKAEGALWRKPVAGDGTSPKPKPQPTPQPAPTPAPEPAKGIFAAIIDAILKLFGKGR